MNLAYIVKHTYFGSTFHEQHYKANLEESWCELMWALSKTGCGPYKTLPRYQKLSILPKDDIVCHDQYTVIQTEKTGIILVG